MVYGTTNSTNQATKYMSVKADNLTNTNRADYQLGDEGLVAKHDADFDS